MLNTPKYDKKLLSRFSLEIDRLLSNLLTGKTLANGMGKIARSISEFINADHATITLLNEGCQYFKVEAEWPELEKSLMGEMIPIVGRGTQSALLNEQRPIVICDLKNDSFLNESPSFHRVAQELDIKSLLIVPLVGEGKTLGTMSVDAIGECRIFTEEEVEFCCMVANQVASSVVNIQLREKLKETKQQLELVDAFSNMSGLFDKRRDLHKKAADAAPELFELVEEKLPYATASLQLIVAGERSLVGASGFDMNNADASLLEEVESDPIISDLIRSRKPKVISRTSDCKEWKATKGTHEVRSWIGIPLVFEDRAIGLLTIDHSDSGYYECIEEELISEVFDIANQTASSFGYLHQHASAEHKNQALEIVRRFSGIVTKELDTNILVRRIAELISEGLQCRRCSVFLHEHKTDFAACKVALELGKPHAKNNNILLVSNESAKPCPTQNAIQTGKAIIIEDVASNVFYDLSNSLYKNAESIIVAPLLSEKQVFGAIVVIHENNRKFSLSDKMLLQTLARQASDGIERDVGFDILHSVGKEILSASGIDEILDRIVKGAMRLTRTDSGVIYVLSPDKKKVAHKKTDGYFQHPPPRLNSKEGITNKVIEKKEILKIDVKKDPHVNPELKDPFQSMFAIPLLLNESVNGVLYLNSRRKRHLLQTEESLLRILGDQASFVIKDAQLNEKLENSRKLYQSVTSHIPQCVFRKDKNLKFTWANSSFLRDIGKTLDELVGKTDFELYDKADAERYQKMDKEVIRKKKQIEHIEPNRPNGKQLKRRVMVVKTPVFDVMNEVLEIQAIFWDVTDEFERHLSELWQSLAQQSSHAIILHESGKIKLANPAAAKLFGAGSPNELNNYSILDFITSDFYEIARGRLNEIESNKKMGRLPMREMRVKAIDGALVDVEVYTQRVSEREILVELHDVRRTKTLLFEMHHRVNRTFNQLYSFVVRQKRFSSNKEVDKVLNAMGGRIHAMSLVHENLFKMAAESEVKIKPYLKEVLNAVQAAHEIEHPIYHSISDAYLDEKRATDCGLIVTELVSNAVEHAFDDEIGKIQVTFEVGNTDFRLVVSDNGKGMNLDNEQSDSMGLTIVKDLIRYNLKGSLKIDKATYEETNPGTCITVDFPQKITIKE